MEIYFIVTRSSDSKSAKYDLCEQRFVYEGTTCNPLNHLNSQHPSTTVKGADGFVDRDYKNMFKKTIYKKVLVD